MLPSYFPLILPARSLQALGLLCSPPHSPFSSLPITDHSLIFGSSPELKMLVQSCFPQISHSYICFCPLWKSVFAGRMGACGRMRELSCPCRLCFIPVWMAPRVLSIFSATFPKHWSGPGQCNCQAPRLQSPCSPPALPWVPEPLSSREMWASFSPSPPSPSVSHKWALHRYQLQKNPGKRHQKKLPLCCQPNGIFYIVILDKSDLEKFCIMNVTQQSIFFYFRKRTLLTLTLALKYYLTLRHIVHSFVH